MWTWRESAQASAGRRSLSWGFTDRSGGASQGPWEGLNLGGHVGDEPLAVTANRAAVAADLGLTPDRLLFMDQVHGAQVAVVEGPPQDGTEGQCPQADAMVTRAGGLALAVLVADCVPVLLADAEAGVVGVAHAGRQGLLAGVVPAAVRAMRDLGARGIHAVVGPSVCPACYEVPEVMAAAAAAEQPATTARSRAGTPAIDIAAGVLAQLADLAVPAQRRPGCTREDDRLFSHRRSGLTGRFAGVVVQGMPA